MLKQVQHFGKNSKTFEWESAAVPNSSNKLRSWKLNRFEQFAKVPNPYKCRFLLNSYSFPGMYRCEKVKRFKIPKTDLVKSSKPRRNWLISFPWTPKPNLDLKRWCWCFPKIRWLPFWCLAWDSLKDKHKPTSGEARLTVFILGSIRL